MKLSIIIPTKNRQKYCIAAVQQIMQLNLKDIEIIIQDNSDDDSLNEYIQKLDSNEIIYNYHPGILSFVDNFSEPISLAKGEYVCIIGDDDGILSNISRVVDFAIKNDIDAIIPSLDIVYFWPSDTPLIERGETGYMYWANKKCNYKYINIEKGLNSLMAQGGQGYQDLNIPRVYHGVVKLSKLNEVKKMTGRYFDGLTPDIYMAVALSFVCRKVIRLNFPITISGICPRSGSSDSATGKHTGELKDAPHFRGHSLYEWDAKAPYIYSVESIWAETVLHALHNFKREDLYSKFSVRLLDSLCYGQYPQFRGRVVCHAKEFGISKLNLVITYKMYKFFGYLKLRFKGLVMRTLKITERAKTSYNVSSILDASEILRKIYNIDC